MKRGGAKAVAFGGVMAALAVVIMCLGGLIPVATFVCPMLCALLLRAVLRICGRRIAWAWYGAVAILCLLLGPDKEAGAVFLVLGYYPIIKPKLDQCRLGLLWKLLLFNGAVIAMYAALLFLFGMQSVANDCRELGLFGLAALLVLGNVTFFLLDKLLGRMAEKR